MSQCARRACSEGRALGQLLRGFETLFGILRMAGEAGFPSLDHL
jgi:hypothetical protein